MEITIKTLLHVQVIFFDDQNQKGEELRKGLGENVKERPVHLIHGHQTKGEKRLAHPLCHSSYVLFCVGDSASYPITVTNACSKCHGFVRTTVPYTPSSGLSSVQRHCGQVVASCSPMLQQQLALYTLSMFWCLQGFRMFNSWESSSVTGGDLFPKFSASHATMVSACACDSHPIPLCRRRQQQVQSPRI